MVAMGGMRAAAALAAATLGAIATPAAAHAQAGPAGDPAAGPNEVVVQGKREREAQIRNFIDSLAPGKFNGQLSRFGAPACPGTLGFTAAQGKAVAARLRAVATAVGAPLAAPGCRPNMWVILTDDRAALADKIRGAWTSGTGERAKKTASTDLATVIHRESLLDANGLEIGAKSDAVDGDGGYYQSEIYTSDRIRPQSSKSFSASAILIEPARTAGLTAMQVADYAAMRLLARADPARLGPDAPATILTALAAPMGAELPLSVTQWDFAFLKALYASDGRSYAGAQKADMQDIIRREITGQDRAPKRRRK